MATENSPSPTLKLRPDLKMLLNQPELREKFDIVMQVDDLQNYHKSANIMEIKLVNSDQDYLHKDWFMDVSDSRGHQDGIQLSKDQVKSYLDELLAIHQYRQDHSRILVSNE